MNDLEKLKAALRDKWGSTMNHIVDLNEKVATAMQYATFDAVCGEDFPGIMSEFRLANRQVNRTAALEAAHAACDDADCESLHCVIGLRNRQRAERRGW